MPRLPPLTQPAGTALPTAAGATELSPAARRCLQEIIGLLDRATTLLREQADGSPPRAAASPRRVAVELAVAGHDRGAVRRRLAAQFALADLGAVLDEVFGAGTPAHQRLPGAAPAT